MFSRRCRPITGGLDAEPQRRREEQKADAGRGGRIRSLPFTPRFSRRLCVSAFRLLLLAAPFLLSPVVPVRPAGAAEEIACRQCHPDKVSGVSVHPSPPTGECLGCHRLVPGRPHPQASDSVRLVESGTKLCATCHGKLLAGRTVHKPVAAGECRTCHAVHRSRYEKLLTTPVGELCVTCHPATAAGRNIHAPVAAGRCLGCHEPHHSPSRGLVKKPGAALCFLCHRRSIAEGESVHQPVAEGDCGACHAPHAAAEDGLLVRHYADEFYLPYKDDNYALCFGCHDPLLAQEERTLTRTGFRNGDKNLHAVHVNMPENGRSCKVCHDPHASGQAELLKRSIPGFGKWEIPLSYTRSLAGGTCVVGCHKVRSYSRQAPVSTD